MPQFVQNLSFVLWGFMTKTRRSGCHCKFTTRLWKMLVAQDTNPAVWTDGVYAFVVFAELEASNWAVFRLWSTSGRLRVA